MGRAFMQYDKNRDGSIDRGEFRQMLNDMGLTYASFCVNSSPGSPASVSTRVLVRCL